MFPTVVSVDYGILRDNFIAMQALRPKCNLVPIIKSDAYGHGLVRTANAFIEGGAQRLGVFRVEEALDLRQAGISLPVWVLLGALHGELDAAFGKGFTLVCFCMEQLEELFKECKKRNIVQFCHLAVDTGMGRLGFMPDELPGVLEYIAEHDSFQCVRGICSHVAKASDPQHPVTIAQVANFRRALSLIPDRWTENHLCASNAWLNNLIPELEYARPGICLYMKFTADGGKTSITEDAMKVATRLVSVKAMPKGSTISYNCIRTLERDSIVAVAPIGYEDGYQRSLSNKGYALVNGKHAPILGTVCMSMTMLDVTDIPGASIGAEAVFLGRQGNEQITIEQLTRLANTTEHELLCAFGKHRIG